MELILQQGLPHQQKAIDAICAVFDGVSCTSPVQFYENPHIPLDDPKIAKLRLFENHWNNATFYALKNLYSVSTEKYKEILDSEVAQFASRISGLCVLDFEKHEKTLYEIIEYVKETYPEVISDIVPLLDLAKMKEEKHRMLKDGRFDRRGKKQFSELINLLIEHSDEINVIKLQEIKILK